MNKNKIGRNELCWCGSNLKFKKCHLDRDKQKPMENWEASLEFNKKFSRRICSSPDSFHHECSQQIIKAHTVPRSSSLKALAENGHVLGLKMSLEGIQRFKARSGFEKIGINNASIFNGFCKKHDDEFFAPIEKHIFINSEEQCFFLAYRAFAREFYAKSSAVDISSLRRQADKGKSLEAQMQIQINNLQMDLGIKTAMDDLKYHKEYFDHMLEAKNFSSVRAVVFTLDSSPPVMVCGGVNPDYDFNGQLIQDLMILDKRTDMLSVTSFFDGVAGKIVFSWLNNSHKTCHDLLASLFEKSHDDLPVFIVQYIVKNFENVFFSPVWWRNVNKDSQMQLLNLLKDSMSLNSDPSAFGLDKKLINIEFPKISRIDFVNWSLSGTDN